MPSKKDVRDEYPDYDESLYDDSDPESSQSETDSETEAADAETPAGLQKKERKKEIRNILLGNFVVYEDGSYGAGSHSFVTPFGFGDGAQETIFFGISQRQFRYETTFRNRTKALYQVLKSMRDVGRRLILQTAPEAAVCYIKSYIFRPVVLAFEAEEDQKQFRLTAYCSRSLFSFLSVIHAVHKLDKKLPEGIRRYARHRPTEKNKHTENIRLRKQR